MALDATVVAEGLRKRYGDTTALDGFDLRVRTGTVHGLLGPNGAGKTTAVRVLTTLVRPDSGRASVAGFDVSSRHKWVRYRIGLVGQHAAVDEILTGRQNLELFGRLLHLDRARARERAGELLVRFGLGEAADRPLKQYSGGMRRRLDLAASLILTPPVLFLDEPTTGLDPRARNEVWARIRELASAGTTVLLTTQYLEEADQLADEVSVVDAGKVVAQGTPEELKKRIGTDRVDIVVRDGADIPAATRLLASIAAGDVELDTERRWLSAPVGDRMAALAALVRTLGEAGVAAEDIALRRPTLDEVFLELTTATPNKPTKPTKEIA
ncbi:daunorubicin resistance ABC transporter ATP-binding subunit [Saccharomonospora marina XMU15]|uniref:Daunorubicin resistance ABC transporter ATP-binding subunit n=1 Tax=Saccharomonospora marina XMU15 TaxID=882083 RepID=H5X9Z5_9PSEU|nr:daunorubicin resistance protein DrrA family ABC transporter ATP-binding protein [Saccharomonospora marina]EHR52633.1 daunorubicin resistance ABC transporter ATP-binding subunit [Saccharomonospora marina XMU15]